MIVTAGKFNCTRHEDGPLSSGAVAVTYHGSITEYHGPAWAVGATSDGTTTLYCLDPNWTWRTLLYVRPESYSPVTGCCPACNGTGRSQDAETNGLCWDCRGTGHPHPGECS